MLPLYLKRIKNPTSFDLQMQWLWSQSKKGPNKQRALLSIIYLKNRVIMLG